jgi:uncharacterized protein (TIGR02145 family)
MRNLILFKLMSLLFIAGLVMNSCREDELFVPVNEDGTSQTSMLKSAVTADYLIGKIETLVSEGSLSEGTGNSLIAKIENAIRSIQNGNINAMKGQLNALIHQVEGLIARGVLTPEEGEPLINGAESQTILSEGSFTDARDGHVYKVVLIGSQLWMAENLAYLETVSSPDQGSETTPFCYVYGYSGNDASVAKQTEYYKKYGVLYNWAAAMNGESSSNSVPSGVQGLCPSGWHLPGDAEWSVLIDYLISNGYGYENEGSDIAKAIASTSGWDVCTVSGTIGNDQASNNRSGFNIMPAEERYHSGYTFESGMTAFSWTSYASNPSYPAALYIHSFDTDILRNTLWAAGGFSVRCVKN